MADTNLMPLAGMNTVAEDAALLRGGDAPRHHVRDAVNLDITPAGKAHLRPGVRRVTDSPLRNLWQSPLHRDTFGTLGEQWGKVAPGAWDFEPLATIGEGLVEHIVLNNLVCAAGPAGLFTFDGARAQRLTLDTPPAPLVLEDEGALPPGTYGVAVSWLRGAQESALSAMASIELPAGGGLAVTLPFVLDDSITGARIYLTKPNGGELLREHDHAPAGTVAIRTLADLGAPAQFQHLSPMPTGRYLGLWRGRLLTAKANVLRFSEAMAYHLHNERHGFVQMPQRITFVQPVDGGIWVGQVDHVAFLSGDSPASLSMVRRASRAPVADSAILVPAEIVGADLAGGGAAVALWLAENGYVAGTADGSLVEIHAGVLNGIAAQSGTSVVLDRRVITAVT